MYSCNSDVNNNGRICLAMFLIPCDLLFCEKFRQSHVQAYKNWQKTLWLLQDTCSPITLQKRYKKTSPLSLFVDFPECIDINNPKDSQTPLRQFGMPKPSL